jgi:hypothetical protein
MIARHSGLKMDSSSNGVLRLIKADPVFDMEIPLG